jgi:hypothetical protein
LVRHVAHNAGRPVLGYRQRLDPREDATGQDNLSPHILAGVVGFMGTVTDLNQGGFDIRAMTVVGETNGIGCPVAEQQVLRPHFPQLTSLDPPAQVRTHQSVLGFSVDWELLALGIRQPVCARPLQDELCRLVELQGCGYAMQTGQGAQILIRSGAAGFIAQLEPLFRRKKRLLSERQRCG